MMSVGMQLRSSPANRNGVEHSIRFILIYQNTGPSLKIKLYIELFVKWEIRKQCKENLE